MPLKRRKWCLSKIFKPSASELRRREKGFILDCIAVDKLEKGTHGLLPEYSIIPRYSAQKDPHLVDHLATKESSQFHWGKDPLSKLLMIHKEEEEARKDIIGPMALHLRRRNRPGAGHSVEEVQGHDFLFSSLKPVPGYNGVLGYRRNCPKLRNMPSSFGIITPLETGEHGGVLILN
ncbi:uncharacterized protein C17orf98-like [Sarcophilus harrisii]|uniref:uncharacterized protein C17orf98-like n=1 Tax=Sarcophilus harrisii TaxID=9305 RepID=UPI000226F00F|nr:uncharacterized protein C17orf98-like [Sarcophilus harrisii]